MKLIMLGFEEDKVCMLLGMQAAASCSRFQEQEWSVVPATKVEWSGGASY